MKAFLDFIPLLAFFFVAKTQGIVAGAGAILIATVIVSIIHLIMQKGKLTKQQVVVLILTIIFCGLTLLLNDEIYLKWKSTYINGIFAVALAVSVLFGKPLLEMAMKNVFKLSKSGWNKLTLAWVGYFALMAFLQYYFAFHTSNETWVNFKSWGWLPFMLVFMIGQFVILKDHIHPEALEDKSKSIDND